MRSIYLAMSAALCAIPLCAWAAALHAIPAYAVPASAQSVSQAASAKGDRTVAPYNLGAAGVTVELTDQPHSAITIRDRNGSLLYRVDPASHTTTVAKRTGRAGTTSRTPAVSRPVVRVPLPDGCESAFSPYVAPDKADVIARCIS